MILRGSIERIEGGLLVAQLPSVAVGAVAAVGAQRVPAEVRRIDGRLASLAAYGSVDGVAHGSEVIVEDSFRRMMLGTCALGHAIDARGRPIDGKAPLHGRSVAAELSAPAARVRVREPLWTGIRCVDALLTLGVGARVGIFGAPGSGKSKLLEMLAVAEAADAVVVALVGERGREAQSWIERCDWRMSVICATSDRSAAERWRAACVALAHARALQERGLHVLVLLDSLARTAAALRELAIATGEPAGRGGYPPSVFAQIARLVEGAGASSSGSVTLVATVLDDGDERDAVSDAARSLLDGHIQLSSALVRANRFPAIDVPASASRTMESVIGPEHARAASIVRSAIARLVRSEDARSLGIEHHGVEIEAAVRCESEIEALLRQDSTPCDAAESLERLRMLAASLDGATAHRAVISR